MDEPLLRRECDGGWPLSLPPPGAGHDNMAQQRAWSVRTRRKMSNAAPSYPWSVGLLRHGCRDRRQRHRKAVNRSPLLCPPGEGKPQHAPHYCIFLFRQVNSRGAAQDCFFHAHVSLMHRL